MACLTLRRISLLLAAGLLSGCGGNETTGPTTPTVSIVEVSPASHSFTALGEVQFSAVARDAGGNALSGVEFSWASSDQSVARVFSDGRVVATGNGSATITATAEGVEGSASVIVAQVVATVEVTRSALTLLVGQTAQLSAQAFDSLGNPISLFAFTWSSSDKAVASVEGTGTIGTVTPVGAGTATITARADGKSATAAVTVIAMSVVDAGSRHTCGVTTGGQAYCWGSNSIGDLGIGTDTGPEDCGGFPCSTTAVAVSGGLTFDSLSVGRDHACGLTDSGTVYCWGWNCERQLGTETTETCQNGLSRCSTTPVAVSGGLTFASLTAGRVHTCAVTTGGQAYCWGNNDFGQLGNGSTTRSTTPLALAGGHTFTSLSAGEEHTCGVTIDGTVYCWGGNGVGQLGDRTTTMRTTPVAVSGGLTFASLTAGGTHTCGVTADGDAYCWGYSQFGQLGNGSDEGPEVCGGRQCSMAPVAVSGGLSFASVSALGEWHTCGIATGGDAYCWGHAENGAVGTTTTEMCDVGGLVPCSTTPVAVSGGLTFATLRAGFAFNCGVTTTGEAYCWGFNASGQLGNGTTDGSTTPVRVLVQP